MVRSSLACHSANAREYGEKCSVRDVTRITDLRRRGRVREARALDGITFDLETGELFGSLGRSGAGKATIELLSAMLGATPDAASRGSSRRRPSRPRR